MKKQIAIFMALCLGVSSLIMPVVANAAPQTFEQLSSGQLTYNASDNPRLNSDPATTATFGGLGIAHGSEGSPAQTTADSNVNQIYTWRLQDLRDHICSNAILTSLHVRATVSATTLGDPDLAALSVYRVNGSDTYNLGNYSVNQGVDYAAATGFATPPNNAGISGVVRGTASIFGGTLPGELEANWDLTGYNVNDTFGIMVQQDSQDGTTDLQTTINTVDVQYDDSACVKDSAVTKTLLNPSSVKPGGTATYEIKITNNGTDPINVGGDEAGTVYDIASPELTYLSVSGNNFVCQSGGTLKDQFGDDLSGPALMYQNHLDYSFLMCGSNSGGIDLQPGESMTFTVNFAVSQTAQKITNTVGFGVGGDEDGPQDPGATAIIGLFGTIQVGGTDLIDQLLSGQLVTNNFAYSVHSFTTSSAAATTNSTLAKTGTPLTPYIVTSITLLTIGSVVAVSRRFRFLKNSTYKLNR